MLKEKTAVVAYVDFDIDDEIYKLREQDEFKRCSKSEILRRLINLGLEAQKLKKTATGE